MSNINSLLHSGEFTIMDQNAVLDQGYLNQSDGKLFLTNKRLIFHINQGNMYRGLELIVQGEKNLHVEAVLMPLEQITHVDKKRLSIDVYMNYFAFQEIMGKKGWFGPEGQGRVYENGPDKLRFVFTLFVNKDEWVDKINEQRNVILQTNKGALQPELEDGDQDTAKSSEPSVMKEKIVIREIVKIKCQYCGTLYEQRFSKCPHCGAS
jgi:hypothetical protein